MKRVHVPRVDARYWFAITLASIFGTNLGDLYAHESGLGIVRGIAVLTSLAALTFVVERRDRSTRQTCYWLVIIIIRTGATNIADYLAYRVRVPAVVLVHGLAVLFAAFAWQAMRADAPPGETEASALPETGAPYWAAMLTAGVFGTVSGDVFSHLVGEGRASIVLGTLLVVALFAWGRRAARLIPMYWSIVAMARTAGTSMGDWLAGNSVLHFGLPLSTAITGLAFVAVLVFWPSRSATVVSPLEARPTAT